jgi:hypothetical protein
MIVLVPLTDLAAFRECGIVYPSTVNQWRWVYRCRHERGLTAAFCHAGRRVLVDVPAFIELSRKPPPALAAAKSLPHAGDGEPQITVTRAVVSKAKNPRKAPPTRPSRSPAKRLPR